MKYKYIAGIAVIFVFFGIMTYLFTQSAISYESNFSEIRNSSKTFKATGKWVREKQFTIDRSRRLFSFYMADTSGSQMMVVYAGAMPNNFESASSVVATGKYHDGKFYAKELLTKCPSKYEASAKK